MSLRRFGRFAGSSVLVCLSLGLAQSAFAHPRVVPVPVVSVQVRPQPMPEYEAKRAVLAQADGQQAGTLRWMDRGELVLDPYEVAAGDARLRLRRDTPVFIGPSRVSLQSLQPGADIRVAYSNRGWGRPEVVAVELLNPDEARIARVRDNPPDCDHDAWRSRPMQPGRVLSLGNGWITYDPYQRSVGDARLRLDWRTPIFAGGRRVSPEALTPGADVKVFYEGNRVVGIELLSWGEARDLRHQYEWARR